MTDKELLELAAKAIGISLNPVEVKNVNYEGDDRFIGYRTDLEEWPRGWFDPLQEDNDALRIATKLSLLFEISEDYKMVRGFYHDELNNDLRPSEATRRAIVRAAAEIGKAKEQ